MKILPTLLWAVLAMLCLPLNAQTELTIDPAVTAWLDNPDRADEAVRLIATFDSPASAAAARPAMERLGSFVGPEFDAMPIQGIAVCPEDVSELTQTAGMIGLWRDRSMQGDLHQAVIVSSVKDVWTDTDFTALNGGMTVEGRGVGVLVNDSGFDGMDSDINATATAEGPRRLVQNVKGTGQDTWIEDSGEDNDQSGGHGTHCMGIVGGDGRKSAGNYKGVAPRAHLLGYGSGAGLFILDVIGGFEYTAQNAKNYNIRVISNSIGQTADTTFTSFDPTNAFAVAAKTLADMNVMTIFSSGNSGSADGTITGNFKTSPWVICVGNGEKNGTLAGSSSRGRRPPGGAPGTVQSATITHDGNQYLWENRPTIVAPGSDIVAARSTLGANISTSDQDEIPADQVQFYTIKTGTSMACPHVAGIVALMLEANPQLEWRAVKAILQRTAIPMQEAYHQTGFGFVNAHAAVAAAFHGLLDVPAGSDYNTKYGLNPNGDFGFDTEAWKTATLHSEVASRIKANIPSALGVEDGCTGPSTIDDTTGDQTDASAPYFDITTVEFLNETATTFEVKMTLGALTGSPAGSAASKSFYDVHFELTKGNDENSVDGNTPPLVYILSAFDDTQASPLAPKQFKLTARTNDGTTRPYTRSGPGQFYEDVTGSWDEATNSITWTVPKASLNLQQSPADNSAATLADRSSRGARMGDKLGRWRAYTYTRAGTTTPDGAGVYNDEAEGACFLNLMQ